MKFFVGYINNCGIICERFVRVEDVNEIYEKVKGDVVYINPTNPDFFMV